MIHPGCRPVAFFRLSHVINLLFHLSHAGTAFGRVGKSVEAFIMLRHDSKVGKVIQKNEIRPSKLWQPASLGLVSPESRVFRVVFWTACFPGVGYPTVPMGIDHQTR